MSIKQAKKYWKTGPEQSITENKINNPSVVIFMREQRLIFFFIGTAKDVIECFFYLRTFKIANIFVV